MKVVYFTKEYPPCVYGGAGVHIENLSKKMVQFCDVEVRTFCESSSDDKIRILNSKKWKELFGENPEGYLKVLEVFSEDLSLLLKRVDGDIIHTHTWYTNFAGVIAKILFKKPLIVTLHSLEPLRVWKENQLKEGYELSKWVEGMAVSNGDGVIAVSKAMKEDIKKIYGVPEDKLEVIYNGLDVDFFKPKFNEKILEKYGINPLKPYLLFVGRMTRQKGIDLLLDVFEGLPDGIQLVMCAGAPDTEELKIEIHKMVSHIKSKKDGLVWIEKMVPKEDLVVLYSHAFLFCCPSVYEPFGIINLEAMATETPVVASGVGGILEVVEDNRDGFLIPIDVIDSPERGFKVLNRERFVEDFRDKILFFLNNRELRVKMGKNGREKVLNKFSWEIVAKKTYDFYKKVLQK